MRTSCRTQRATCGYAIFLYVLWGRGLTYLFQESSASGENQKRCVAHQVQIRLRLRANELRKGDRAVVIAREEGMEGEGREEYPHGRGRERRGIGPDEDGVRWCAVRAHVRLVRCVG